jgi:hypothetical protein
MPSLLDSYPRRDATFRLVKGTVVVNDRYRPRIVTLENLGCQIWVRVDGLATVRDIAGDIARQTNQPAARVEAYTVAMTGVLLGEGLLFLSSEPKPQPYHVAIPQDEQDPNETIASMRAAGWAEQRQPDEE